MAKYISENGLLYVWQKIKTLLAGKVDTVSGKGLSTNDLDNTLKSHYDTAYSHSQTSHAPSNAEANTIETIKVNGAAVSISNKGVDISIPTGTLASKNTVEESDLDTALREKVNAASEGNHSHLNKVVLDGITAEKVSSWDSAEANVITAIKVNNISQSISGKAVNIVVPTKVSDLQNDNSYMTTSEVSAAIANADHLKRVKVSALPAISAADVNTIYMVLKDGSESDVYNEYMVIDGAYELIGNSQVDLSNYITFDDMIAVSNAEIDTIFAS